MENMGNQVVNTGQQGNTQNAAEGTEKTFTQEEVNRIVQERLARVKMPAEPDQRELDLQKRERALYAKEAVANAGLDKELADEFAGMDKETIDKCLKIIAPYAQKMKEPILNAVGPTGGSDVKDNAIRRAMGLKV